MRPSLVEIGDQHFEAVGIERRVEPRQVGELIRGVMHAGVERAPEPPALLALEFGQRHRKVMARIPLIESLAQRRLDHGANDEIGFGHELVPFCATLLALAIARRETTKQSRAASQTGLLRATCGARNAQMLCSSRGALITRL
jgi:hypothetical protein